MAKSLRSKWKRKMRCIKRERYGAKENDRLVQMLAKAGEFPQNLKKEDNDDTTMGDDDVTIIGGDISTASLDVPVESSTTTKRRSRRQQHDDDKNDKEEEEEGAEMAVDKPERVFSRSKMRDQFGNYPIWMNKRKIETQKKKNKRINKRKASAAMGKRVKRLRC